MLLIFGLGLSIPLIVFGSTLLLKVMERFPVIIVLAPRCWATWPVKCWSATRSTPPGSKSTCRMPTWYSALRARSWWCSWASC